MATKYGLLFEKLNYYKIAQIKNSENYIFDKNVY